MDSKVHYFSFYLSKEMEEWRQANHASFAKIEYVKSVIVNSGKKINLVSTALANKGYQSRKVVQVGENERHIYLPTFSYPGKLFTGLALLFMWFHIVLYVILHVKKNDQVLIYHSLLYIEPFNLLRKIKKFSLILEFNDLYHVVSKKHAHKGKKEIEFIQSADAYLFMNSIAEEKFNKAKPYALSYGNYELPKKSKDKFSDDKIHAVYAGIIENGRRAAELAAQSSLYLDSSFIVHILGFGTDAQLRNFEELVEGINAQKGYEAVIFHGRLRGQEFSDFLHSCHIGISSHAYLPEEMDSANYTFPSKIPTYMSHDLYVVSPDIPCVVHSPFAEFTTFYHEHKPQDIAKAITECANNTMKKNALKTPAQLIANMDKNFLKEMKRLLNH